MKKQAELTIKYWPNPERIVKGWAFLFLILFISMAGRAQAATYYIDYSSGSDSNNGTSKTTPWQHAPGMYGASGLANSTNPKPGDNIILKGGVTWPNAALGWAWIWSGNATTQSPGCTGSGCIYIGVDQTWYTGSAWARPIINAGGTPVTNNNGNGANILLRIYGSYIILDNIEFTGLYWSGVPAYGTGINIALAGGEPGLDTNDTLEHLYIHGWSHGSYASGTVENPCAIAGDTAIPNNNANTIVINSVIDGSDTAKDSCSAFFGAPPYVEQNEINDVSSGLIVDGPSVISGNTITNVVKSFDTGAHTNAIEINASENVVVSNNIIAHLGVGTLGIWAAPDSGYGAYIFNNVMYDTDTGNILDLAQPVGNNGCANNGTYCTSAGTDYVYNNTIECGPNSNPDAVCAGNIPSALAAAYLTNNYWITNMTSPNNGIWSTNGGTATVVTNLAQTAAAATSAGYTMGESNPFSPSSASSPTVGKGTNLTSICSGLLSGLCTSTALGVNYNTTNHIVTSPYIVTSTRPSSGAWDIGAYQYSSGSFQQCGDANGDGVINIADALMVAQSSVGLVTLTSAQKQAAEVSSSAETAPTIYDALLIAEYAVGLITGFPNSTC